jgi:hypothetical protein
MCRVDCRAQIAAEYEFGGICSRVSFWLQLCIATSPALIMRALTLLPLLYIHSALTAPASDAQIVLGETAALVDTLRGGLVSTEGNVIHKVENVSYEDKVETWVEEDRDYVKQNGLVCASFQCPDV